MEPYDGWHVFTHKHNSKQRGAGITRPPMHKKVAKRNRRKRHQKRGRRSAVRGSRAK